MVLGLWLLLCSPGHISPSLCLCLPLCLLEGHLELDLGSMWTTQDYLKNLNLITSVNILISKRTNIPWFLGLCKGVSFGRTLSGQPQHLHYFSHGFILKKGGDSRGSDLVGPGWGPDTTAVFSSLGSSHGQKTESPMKTGSPSQYVDCRGLVSTLYYLRPEHNTLHI